jgi:hypothetical protein
MISTDTTLQSLLKSNYNISMNTSATIEYNLNSMVDDIVITTPGISYPVINGVNAYSKSFPVKSVLKPFRPIKPGIKYLVYTTGNTDTPSQSFSSIRALNYPTNQPRVYLPGEDSVYKYWITPKNTNASINIVYSKDIYTNKVIVRFETFHSTPTSCTITGKTSTGTTVFTVTDSVLNSNGEAVIYYNGSTWSTTEPATYTSQSLIRQLAVTAVNPGGGKVLGVIEVSPRWVKDITSDIVTIDIVKESSADAESIIPVGSITSNSLSMDIAKYNYTSKTIKEYNRSDAIDQNALYLFKNAEIKTYFNVVGASTYSLPQGNFYMSSWVLGEFDEVNISGLDGAKYLQETFAPEILCDNYLATAVIRRLLDAVGFSNYNFNLNTEDASVPFIKYWWTDDTKTVWQCLQELCQDIQMNAFFDENNILQFYSREKMYSQNSVWTFRSETDGSDLSNIISLNQREIPSGNYVTVIWNAPVSSEYYGTASPLWKSDTTYLGAGALAATITNTSMEIVLNPSVVDYYANVTALYSYNGFLLIDSEVIEFDAMEYSYEPILVGGNPNTSNIKYNVWITSPSDVNKYRYLSKPGYRNLTDPTSAYFQPTGRYRIKGRGMFGTTPAPHSKAPNDVLSSWQQNDVSWY